MKKCNPIFSVIIPVYNAEKRLRRTLDSVLHQTLTDWECICVNDGSCDGSKEILEEYKRRDARFKVIHKENGGVSQTRNVGLGEAAGRYVFFFDSDDVITDDCLRTLENAMVRHEADVCSCNVRIQYADGTSHLMRPSDDVVIERGDFVIKRNFIDTTVVWGKAIDRKLFDDGGLRFDEGMSVAEDSLLMSELVCLSHRIVHLGSFLGYVYTSEGEGLMFKNKKCYPACVSKGCDAFLRFAKGRNEAFTAGMAAEWMNQVYMIFVRDVKNFRHFPVNTMSLSAWKIAFKRPKLFVKWFIVFAFSILRHT